ncbi:MAG: hypothetical protein Q4D98_13530 [Planctomycetia bacterium]|nr:hypothetical protein [Planctomycetia bacterium]
MWLFCRSGFFSAVQHFENAEVIHVRARFEGDLERLCETHGVTADVKETPGNDYRFRMDFDRETWARIVSEEAEAIDYTNFKNAVHDGTVRDRAYMDCWAAMSSGQYRSSK